MVLNKVFNRAQHLRESRAQMLDVAAAQILLKNNVGQFTEKPHNCTLLELALLGWLLYYIPRQT